jgi:hypothetical protein
MKWGSDRTRTIAELERQARWSGSFVDRAIVREVKIASARFSETDSAWSEVVTVAERWEEVMPDLQVLEAIRRVNRVTSCWRGESTPSQWESASCNGGVRQ